MKGSPFRAARLCVLAAGVLLLAPLASSAQSDPAAKPAPANPHHVLLSGGALDWSDTTGMFAAELRFKKLLWWVRPHVGLLTSGKGAFYGHFGFGIEVPLPYGFSATPALAMGLWDNGNGEDLGNILEFRSGGELAWRHENGWGVSAGYYHISNASLSRRNPGLDYAQLSIQIPLSTLTPWRGP